MNDLLRFRVYLWELILILWCDLPAREVCGNCQYSKVQLAIEAAGPGDLVRIGAGVYTENVTTVSVSSLDIEYAPKPRLLYFFFVRFFSSDDFIKY